MFSSLRVLMVEDNPGDAGLVREMFRGVPSWDLLHADALAGARAILTTESVDAILLDLNLPDSEGVETVDHVRGVAGDLPILVLTGMDDEDLALASLQRGAQDYLTKGQIDPDRLKRALRYAIERRRLTLALEAERQQARRERELRQLAAISGPREMDVTGALYGKLPLKAYSKRHFEALVSRYRDLLDAVAEGQKYKVDHRVSARLRDMAGDLGVLKAGPRDLVEIHTEALGEIISTLTPQQEPLYAEEGRLMLLELMGYLAGYYRQFAPASRWAEAGGKDD